MDKLTIVTESLKIGLIVNKFLFSALRDKLFLQVTVSVTTLVAWFSRLFFKRSYLFTLNFTNEVILTYKRSE